MSPSVIACAHYNKWRPYRASPLLPFIDGTRLCCMNVLAEARRALQAASCAEAWLGCSGLRQRDCSRTRDVPITHSRSSQYLVSDQFGMAPNGMSMPWAGPFGAHFA